MKSIKLLGAINKDTGEYIHPKFASKNDKYKCPECEQDLIFSQGRKNYFAHKKETDPCNFYKNPTETQIRKDAKFLLKSIIENNINLKIKRNCISRFCNYSFYEHILEQYNHNCKVYIDYKIKHEEKTKFIDVAYIDDNNAIIALFEICCSNKTCKEDRPKNWYEINAEQLIDIVNENIQTNELSIKCIRQQLCLKCRDDYDYDTYEDNINEQIAQIKLAKMIPYDKYFRCREGPFIDYPIHSGVLIDEIINMEHIKKYLPEHIYNSIEYNTDNKTYILSKPEIIKYLPHIPQVFDGNFVPSFELRQELCIYSYITVDLAIPHNGNIVEVWILSKNYNNRTKMISEILRYIPNCSIYIINKDWILEQNNDLSKEEFYNNAKKVAKCFKIKPIEFRNTNIYFDFTNIYIKVPYYQIDKAKSLEAKWDCNNKLWFIKHDNKNKEYILTLFNQINLNYKGINETEKSKIIEKIILDVTEWGILLKNQYAIEFLKDNFDCKALNCDETIELPEILDCKALNCDETIELPEILDCKALDWDELSSNPDAIELLKNNQNKINWSELSRNPNAIELLKNNQNKINWKILSSNPNAIELLKENKNGLAIDWEYLSSNPNAIELLKKNIKKINWKILSSNPNAIELLKDNQDKIDWFELNNNTNAIKLLKILIFP